MTLKGYRMSTTETETTTTRWVTVAIPSYNQGKFLELTVQSILDQDIKTEICIADGGSTDQSPSIIESYKDLLHWAHIGPDGGQSSAINEAISSGSAPYVCWLNSDDILIKGALKKMINFLENHPEIPMVYGKSKLICS